MLTRRTVHLGRKHFMCLSVACNQAKLQGKTEMLMGWVMIGVVKALSGGTPRALKGLEDTWIYVLSGVRLETDNFYWQPERNRTCVIAFWVWSSN